MKRGIVFVILIMLLVFFFSLSLNAEKNKISSEVFEKVHQGQDVKVYIKFKINQEGKAINLKKEILNLNNKIKYKFDDKVSAFVSEKDLEELQNNPNVESVELIGTRKVFLQDSAPLINATTTWELKTNEINLTGKGETICIIDTGVNYSHPDLGGCYGGNNISSSCKIIGGYDFCADDVNCTTFDSNPMDVNGHGTHVTGIVAANGTIKGVAPDAKIIIIKAGNASGIFWDDDLEKAIDWCVENSSKFNISVISMSLGSVLNNSYCNSDPLTDEINSAVAKNISVVIATGNIGNFTYISAPACVQNATPVGATNKTDSIIYNRNALVQLLAPGYQINSTWKTGDYSVQNGTSMSAPHVAGAIAIINQYLNLTEQLKTPQEIETILYNTGKKINDSGYSNLNYSRINLYNAILSLDNIAPNITLISPNNNLFNESSNQTFVCNATDWQLSNITFYLWNSSHEIINQTSINISGKENQTEFNITNLSNGIYKWNCLGYDLNGNSAYALLNYTLDIGNLSVILSLPLNNTYQNTNDTAFICNSKSTLANLTNTSFYLWNSTGNLVYNETQNISGNSNETTFYYNLTKEDNYEWNCYTLYKNLNLAYAEENYSITLDIVSPNITLVSPGNNYETSATKINFKYNLTDTNIANCSLIINNKINQTENSVISGQVNEFSNIELSLGNYDWKIKCVDFVGNNKTTLDWNLKIISTPSSGGGSSSSSFSLIDSPITFTINDADFVRGITKTMKQNDKMKFKINNTYHLLELLSIFNSNIKISILSNPINLTIKKGETKKVDINNDKIYDFKIILNSIFNSSANITIMKINESIGIRQILDENKTASLNETNEENQQDILKEKINKNIWIISTIFILILVFFMKKLKK